MDKIKLAEVMLQSMATVRKEEERQKGNKIQKVIEKRKSSLIDTYFNKKPRNE